MTIENTTDAIRRNPMAGLLMGLSGGIEASERRGQQQLVNSDRLPSDTRGKDAAFIALGFTFGEPDANDSLFRPATLPSGWKREGSDHAMWSYIVDERGIKRVGVFYKAAYYDRRADMHVVNVGRDIGSHAIYGDEAPTAASMRLDVLTPGERDDLEADVAEMRHQINETPSIYGKYANRVAVVRAILEAHPRKA